LLIHHLRSDFGMGGKIFSCLVFRQLSWLVRNGGELKLAMSS
jgi:hypothetical protein